MNTLGKRISTFRKQKKLTQEELAQQLHVTSQAVNKWENDISIPELSILIELSNLFKITLDQLIKDTNETFLVSEKEPLILKSNLIEEML